MNNEIIKRVNDRLDEAIDRGRNLVENEELQERLNVAKDQAEDYIRENPVKSVLIGFAVGFLISKIFESED